jgi:PAS domain S-box-containing protein
MRFSRLTMTLYLLLLLQAVFFIAVYRGTKQECLKDADLLASNMAIVARSTTDDFFDRYLAIFEVLKNVDHIARQETDASNEVLQYLRRKYPEVVNFAAVKKDGYFFASGMPLSKNNIPNIKHLEFFQRIRSGEKRVTMQPHTGPISKDLVTGIVVPLEDELGLFNGLIGVSIKFQYLVDQWERLFSISTVMMAVYDEKGTAFYLSPGLKKYEPNFSAHILSEKFDRIQLGNLSHVIYTVTDPGSKWRISAVAPTHVKWIDLVKTNYELLFVLALMVITIAILGLWYHQERSREEKFRHVFESANVGKSITSIDGKVFVNKAFADMLGYRRKELRNKSWQELTPPEEIEGIAAIITPLMNAEKDSARFTKRYRCKNGDFIWADVNVAIKRGKGGKPLYFITTIVDITTRVRIEKQLRLSEERFSKAFELSSAGITITRIADGKIIDVNDAWLCMFEFSREEVLGRTSTELNMLAPQERQKMVEAQLASGWLRGAELAVRSKSGNIVTVLFSTDQLELYDKSHIITTVIDITERKKMEEAVRKSEVKYRQLFEKMGAGFVLFEVVQDQNGTPVDLVVMEANNGFEKTTGLKSQDVVGKRLTQVLPGIEDDPADWIGKYGQIALTGQSRQFEQDSELLGAYYTIHAYQNRPQQCAVTFIDITDQKKAEIDLRRSEGLLSTLIKTLPDLVWLKDVDGVYLACNTRFESFFGAKEKDIVGKTDFDFVDKEMADSFREHDKTAMEKSSPTINEEEIEFADDGHYEYLETIKSPMYSRDGKLLGVLGIGRDITSRKLAEKALKESEQKLSNLLRNLQGIAYRCRNDRDWTMVFMSDGCHELTGYAPEDFVQNEKMAFADIIHPQDKPRIWDIIQGALEEGRKFEIEYRVVAAGGDQKWVNERGLQVGTDEDGTILLEGFISDISEQKRIEEELRYQEQLLSQTGRMAKVGGWRFEPSTGEGTWTAETARIHDIDPEEQTNLAKGLSYYQGEHRERIEKAVRDAVKSGRPYDLELELKTAKNRSKTVRIIGQPVVAGKKTVEVRGSIQDITDRVQLGIEIRRSHEEIRALTSHVQDAMEKEKITIAREIHDDFGQTLSALKLDISWIKKRLHQEQTVVVRKLDTMTAVINDSVQSVKRICSDLRPAILDDFGLGSAVQWLLNQYQERTDIHVDLTSDLDETTISPAITTAAFRICQEALTNINRHAKATRVEVTLTQHADRLTLHISDNGCGISDKEPAKMASFGLIGMRERSLALGGRFGIASEPGKGTRISASFPLDPETE